MNEHFNFRYKIFPALINQMQEAYGKMFVFVEKGQLLPPFEDWSNLQPVNKKLDGGIAICDIKTGELLTKPSMSIKSITAGFKKVCTTLDESLVRRQLENSNNYAIECINVHHGRFLTYSE